MHAHGIVRVWRIRRLFAGDINAGLYNAIILLIMIVSDTPQEHYRSRSHCRGSC